MGYCDKTPSTICSGCISCEKEKYSYIKHGCDGGCIFCDNSGCYHHFIPEDIALSKKQVIKWISTPKCKNCIPTLDMLTRKSCSGCSKFNM